MFRVVREFDGVIVATYAAFLYAKAAAIRHAIKEAALFLVYDKDGNVLAHFR